MKSINAKRIAAVAASLLVGLAAAGQGVTFGNIPIINSQGQPVVQIVVGSTAQPSDGVVAANIAAVIGSLAHTSTNVTATLSGRSGVNCVVTTPSCTLSNQQVWLGEQGFSVPVGSFQFSALIGSVLNPGVLNSGNLVNTKTLSSSTTYTYPDSGSSPYPITSTPTATSAFAGIGIQTQGGSVSAGTNAGGVTFSGFRAQGATTLDNVLQITSGDGSLSLLSNSGTYQETESLWLAGFPVYDQQTGALSLLSTTGAYLLTFGKPIQYLTNNAPTIAQFTMLGSNWTVQSMTPPTTLTSSSNFVVGGNVTLAQAATKVQTVYVGQNITAGQFRVVLTDLSYPNSNDQSYASLQVYNNGVPTNTTSAGPGSPNGQSITINSSGTKLYITVSQTFPGLYAYQKWAKIQLFSNTVNVASNKNFNTANGNSWLAALRWTTNQTVAGAETTANSALEGIVLYSNQSSSTGIVLTPGSTFTYITNPATWTVNFAGDALGAPSNGNANYDPLVISTGSLNSQQYSNPGSYTPANGLVTPAQLDYASNGIIIASSATVQKVNITTVTEPVNWLKVASSIPTAFQVNPASLAAPTSNLQTLTYNLDPYALDANTLGGSPQAISPNSITATGVANVLGEAASVGVPGLAVEVVGPSTLPSNQVSSNNQLGVTVYGFRPGSTSPYPQTVYFSAASPTGTWASDNGVAYINVTGISLSWAIPNPGVKVLVYDSANTATIGSANFAPNSILLGTLQYVVADPTLLYSVPQYGYQVAPTVSSVTYTGEQNNVNFVNSASTFANSARNQYFSYTIPEIDIPGFTTASSNVIIGLTNSSSTGVQPNPYWLNVTNSQSQQLEYQSSQSATVGVIKAPLNFRTERGGNVASISTQQVVYDEPRTIDGLEFVIGPAATASNSLSHSKLAGPYKVGQATNIPNVTIGAVNATCVGSGQSVCSVTGLANLTAVPSVAQAVVPTTLNTATTPLAVLDSNSNSASTLIVVGSKYVNSVAAQIFSQNPSFDSSFGGGSVVVQAFGTNRVLVAGYSAAQTVQAGNQFIADLLANATV